MKRYLIVIIIALTTLFLYACDYDNSTTGNTLSGDSEVYATDVNILNSSKTFYVGDSFVLNSDIFTITPATITVNPIINIDNTQIISYNDDTNTITCNEIGTAVITITVPLGKNSTLPKTITVTVVRRPVYIDSLYVEHDNIEMNLGDEDVLNNLVISPTGSSRSIQIFSSNGGVAQYDGYYVKAIGEGSTTITCRDLYTGKSVSFNVTVTNYVYATSVTTEQDSYCFKLGDIGNIPVTISPEEYNMPVTCTSSDLSVLTIDDDGNYEATGVGTATVDITYYIGKNVTAKKSISVEVVQEVGVLTSSFKFENESRAFAFADNSLTYTFTVTGDTSMSSANFSATVNGEKLKTISNMIKVSCTNTNGSVVSYEITFYAAGHYIFGATYSNPYENGSVITSNNVEVDVYNVITDPIIEFSAYEEAIEKVDGGYNLALINQTADAIQKAEQDEIIYCGILTIDPNILSVYQTGYTLEILDSEGSVSTGISYDSTTGLVSAISAGEYKIVLTALDDLEETFVIPFEVSPATVTEIKNGEESVPEEITLYLQSTNEDYPCSFEISPTALPIYAYDTNISVEISDEEVVSYENGQITALASGSSTITFTCGEIQETITVIVNNYVESIELKSAFSCLNNEKTTLEFSGDEIYLEIMQGSTLCLSFNTIVTGFDEYNQFKFTYFDGSSSESFSESGKDFRADLTLTATGFGQEKIVVTTQYPSALNVVITVNVLEYIEITSIEFESDEYLFNLAENGSTVFSYLPTINPTVYNDVVTYSSSDESVAEVTTAGEVSVKAEGTAIIHVLVNNEEMDSYTLTVIDKVFITEVSSVNYSVVDSNEIGVGSSGSLGLSILPLSASVPVEYSSSNENMTVATDGSFEIGENVGECTITARYETSYGEYEETTFSFNIVIYVDSASFDTEEYSLDLNTTTTATHSATILPAAYTLTANTITYQSSDESVATVDNAGQVTGLSAGTTTISVLANGEKLDFYTLTVIYDIFIETVSSSYSSVDGNDIVAGTTGSLSLIITPNDATVGVSYSSNDTSKITINSDGSFEVKNISDSCILTARYETARGVYEEASFEFNILIHVISAEFGSSSYSIGVGETATFSATILPDNTTDTITYQSSDESVATVDNAGQVTGLIAGTTTISILANGDVKASYSLTVESSSLTAEQVIIALSDNKDVTLTNDITLPDGFATISSYSATFDGAGYTVNNLKTTFITTNSGTIKDLIFAVSASLSVTNTELSEYVGEDNFVAVLCNENSGTINNVEIDGLVDCTSNNQNFAGFVYYNSGTITNCLANLTATGVDGIWCGFVYENKTGGRISSCNVSGSAAGFKRTFGFVCQLLGGSISDCEVSGFVIALSNSSSSIAAGFMFQDSYAGSETSSEVTNCLADVTYSGGASDSKIGGFIYQRYSNETRTQINSCVSEVSLVNSNVSTSKIGTFVFYSQAGTISNFGIGNNINKSYSLIVNGSEVLKVALGTDMEELIAIIGTAI